MNTYSVKEIADMLNTSSETVRRWIREGKLCATQSSRKGGNIVKETDLQKFIASTPKYARIASMGAIMAMTPFIGGPLLAGFIGGLSLDALKNYCIEKGGNSTQILSQELINFLESEVVRHKEKIKQLEEDIQEEQRQIDEINVILSQKITTGRKEV